MVQFKKKIGKHYELRQELIRLIESGMQPRQIYPYYEKEFRSKYGELSYESFSRLARMLYSELINGVSTAIAHDKADAGFGVGGSYKSKEDPIYKDLKFDVNDCVAVDPENFKRIVVLSDLHCGHRLGLTPPEWQYNSSNSELKNFARLQKEAWDWYVKSVDMVEKDHKVDVLVINGDLIDGDAHKNRGVELLTTDRLTQAKIGVSCVKEWDVNKIYMTRGTPYHVGHGEQFEETASIELGAVIDDVINFQCNGVRFNFRHKVGGSSVPYGKSTPVIKEGMWNQLIALHNNEDYADVIVRSHVHYFTLNRTSNQWAITTPALQLNSRYGQQQCAGTTDFGFIVIDVYDNGVVNVSDVLAKIKSKPVEYVEVS